eukprot:TRINITY_DN8569_c0_g2_i1.p1 TRINITY_DN8569_c0_g2~~TRINITY_DN8569_c0_g2_i1.p1  ORF type:complete len:336 (+),score=30.81 TRINITY_DN8569_c0_g2_i1:61-1008(+)
MLLALLALQPAGGRGLAPPVSEKTVYVQGELRLRDPRDVGEVVLSPRPHTYLTAADLPSHYDPNDVDGLTLTTADLNQHIPLYCGSCWAHAAASSLADRLKIASKGKGRDVIPAIQTLLDCSGMGCSGGDPNAANAWIHKNGGVADVTCRQYQSVSHNCSADGSSMCMNCAGWHCYPVHEYSKIDVVEYGSVSGDHEIMAEIYARGPVSCTIDASVLGYVTDKGAIGYTGGICNYTAQPTLDHAIQIAGWGEENGIPFWIGRNSWGTYWGERGWFRIARAAANATLNGFVPYRPGTCYWAVPKLVPAGGDKLYSV